MHTYLIANMYVESIIVNSEVDIFLQEQLAGGKKVEEASTLHQRHYRPKP
jgi:hypothetical protein